MEFEAQWEKWCPKPTEEERGKVSKDRKKRQLVREEERRAIEATIAEEAEEISSDDEDKEGDEHIDRISSSASGP